MDNIKFIFENNSVLIDGDFKLSEAYEALDIIFGATYESSCNNVILNKENIDESFFDLRTGFAGELLQKLINYNCKLAIVGDFSIYDSKALKDFIFECNKGKDFYFVESIEKARERFLN